CVPEGWDRGPDGPHCGPEGRDRGPDEQESGPEGSDRGRSGRRAAFVLVPAILFLPLAVVPILLLALVVAAIPAEEVADRVLLGPALLGPGSGGGLFRALSGSRRLGHMGGGSPPPMLSYGA